MLSDLGLVLLQKFLTYDPAQRITAEDALQHPYFGDIPLPIDPSMFPIRPAKSELGLRRALATSPKAPLGGAEQKQLVSYIFNLFFFMQYKFTDSCVCCSREVMEMKTVLVFVLERQVQTIKDYLWEVDLVLSSNIIVLY